MSSSLLKLNPANFVPVTRTPWAGHAISAIKRRYQSEYETEIHVPDRIGESWEVSTDGQFPSTVVESGGTRLLIDVLQESASALLGEASFVRYGVHCPLLLKWIEASTLLSAQVHPNHQHPALAVDECGKPEAWLVLATEKGGFVYLGFRDGISDDEIRFAIAHDDLKSVLHKVEPKPFDYIAVPTGCVHALGPGVMVVEPQCVLPGRAGKTWRISDWGRRYNASGEEDAAGEPRPLHRDEALSAIDWNLPRGVALERHLIRSMKHEERFLGDLLNPCAAQLFTKEGSFRVAPLVVGVFMLATVWNGTVTLRSIGTGESITLHGGESALVGAGVDELMVECEDCGGHGVGLALFALLTS
jgi:mannose-6-phosphate isomerase class I